MLGVGLLLVKSGAQLLERFESQFLFVRPKVEK